MEDNRKKVLLIGENPDCFSGNGNMMGSCLEDIDPNKYNVCAFLKNEVPIDMINDPFEPETTFNCTTISSFESGDAWGKSKLVHLLGKIDVDIVVFVGIDIWRYVECFNEIDKIRAKKNFIIKMIVPYDLWYVRKDWISWFNFPDQIYVYSEYGYDMIKDHVQSAKYYRPRLRFHENFEPLDRKEKNDVRNLIFPDIDENTIIFGYVGNNMIRKNIYNMMRGFADALKENKNMILYLHLNNIYEVFGIERIKADLELSHFNLRHNANSRKLSPTEMSVIWNTFDYHMIPSFQEGLSWTVVESKLSGIPSIISNSTSHKDFINMTHNMHFHGEIKDPDNIFIVAFPDHEEMIPLITNQGPAYLFSNVCSYKEISNAIKIAQYRDLKNKNDVVKDCVALGKKWIENCHNFQTNVLDDNPKQKENNDDDYGEML